jgi:hypothetical protein
LGALRIRHAGKRVPHSAKSFDTFCRLNLAAPNLVTSAFCLGSPQTVERAELTGVKALYKEIRSHLHRPPSQSFSSARELPGLTLG